MAVPTVPPKDVAVTSKDVTYGDAHSASLAAVLTEKQDPCTHLPQANTQGTSPPSHPRLQAAVCAGNLLLFRTDHGTWE